MLRVFIGYDPRQPVAYTALQQSIFTKASQPVAITPLVIEQLPINRVGLTTFTFSRFLVPHLCNYKGVALFLDADMLLQTDINQLFDLMDLSKKVMVVKHEMRFEWASMMLFNCEKCKILTPEYIENSDVLHSLGWAKDSEIGELDSAWNHLVGYDKERVDANLVHYTQGIPGYPEVGNCEYKSQWISCLQNANGISRWQDVLGQSIHAININGQLMPKLSAKELVS